MIKKIELQNIFGVEDFQELNFEVKHLKEGQINFENGIIKSSNGEKIMLTPTLISKNATGKTSILRAIEFSDKVNSIDDLVNIFFFDAEYELSKNNRRILSRVKRNVMPQWSWKKKIKYALQIIYDQFMIHVNISDKYSFNVNVKKKIEQVELDIKKKINNHYYEKDFIDEKSISYNELYSNFLQMKKTNKDIIIRISYTDPKYDKLISVGETIKFNKQEKQFSQIKKEIYDKTMEKIDHLEIFDLLLHESAFNEFLNSRTQSDFHFHNRERHINENTNKNFIFIDDLSIHKLIDNKNLWSYRENDFLLNDLISQTSHDIVNSVLKIIDTSISHVEKQKNGLYEIIDKNKIVKSFNSLSFGTIKILIILEQFLHNSKNQNKTILIDEIENGLNFSLINLLINFFTNKTINKNKNQVIITTHNPIILSNNIINPLNGFIYFEDKFINPFDEKKIITRTEEQNTIFKNKNYYNDLFWNKKLKKHNIKYTTNTISDNDFYDIINTLEEQNE